MFLLQTLKFLGLCLEVLIIFNVIIIVHELGHFLAARWRGLYVEEFGVWFGKPLWRRKIRGVYYSLGTIPAGGFVKLPQMAPMESIEGESEIPPDQLRPVRPLDKIIVAFAGPLFSFLLALLLAVIVWTIGKPVSDADETTVIGYVEKGGPADLAGLRGGDEILEINGQAVKRFGGTNHSVVWNIIRSEGEKILFKIRRDGAVQEIWSGWTKEKTADWRRPALRKVMIGPRMAPWVHLVEPKSIAGKAGLRAGDLIEQVDGQAVADWREIEALLFAGRGRSLALRVDRNGRKVDLTLAIPSVDPGKPEAEIELGVAPGKLTLVHPRPWPQVTDSVEQIINMVGALAAKHSDVKTAHFSGPVGIMNLYYRIFQAPEGWRLAIAFSVFFNVNLALLNMLPLPVLDGGHITLAILEAIRRKPANSRIVEIVNTACAVLLFGFMLYVSFFDIGDLFGKDKAEPKPPPPAAESAAPREPAK